MHTHTHTHVHSYIHTGPDYIYTYKHKLFTVYAVTSVDSKQVSSGVFTLSLTGVCMALYYYIFLDAEDCGN